MEVKPETEIKSIYNRCKCCLENGELFDMWAQYVCDEEVEVYGDMLRECFQFPWNDPADHLEQICDKCVEELRRSLNFRRTIVAAQEVLDKLIQQQSELATAELENIKEDQQLETLETDDGIDAEDGTYLKHEELESELDEITGDLYESVKDDHEAEYLSCDMEEDNQPTDDSTDMVVEYLDNSVEDKSSPTKMTRKKGKGNRVKLYKQYSQHDMEAAIEEVVESRLSRSEAAERYSVPLKTLSLKLRTRNEEPKADDEAKTKQTKFFEEIGTILTYTNATPFKTKVGRFFCAYCTTDGPVFESTAVLRTHTRTEHAHERLKGIGNFMKPYYLNEVLKLDIANLQCTVCVSPIKDWNSMFEHLNEIHNVELDSAYSRVIPYVLSEDVFCCLCDKKYSHFHMLDVHMNSHYSNYICGECGDTFLTESRMKKHVETHSTQRFPCTECAKVFTLDKYRRKHYYGVHLKERKFNCHYCSESFHQEYSRHLHVLEKHTEKVKMFNCEYCSMTFTWRPYYLKHIKFNHTKPEKKFKCKLCPKVFYQKNELRNHEQWHAGKGFTCEICEKKFSSKSYLHKHILTHAKDSKSQTVVFVIEDRNAKDKVENNTQEDTS